MRVGNLEMIIEEVLLEVRGLQSKWKFNLLYGELVNVPKSLFVAIGDSNVWEKSCISGGRGGGRENTENEEEQKESAFTEED